MNLTMMKGKLHRATVTEANIDYEGSVAIDRDLMDSAGFLPYEQVDIYNITNGERLTTYVIPAPRGSRQVGIQGAAAHKASVGDRVIIAAYAEMSEEEAQSHTPNSLLLNEHNEVISDGGATTRAA